jgi:DNA-binding transcriptional LysR family regulator
MSSVRDPVAAAPPGFSAAAEALTFTQSAVSQQIAALERETGTRLIERGVRPVRLTDEHEALPEPQVHLDRTYLLDDPFDLVIAVGRPLARRASVALEDLAGET